MTIAQHDLRSRSRQRRHRATQTRLTDEARTTNLAEPRASARDNSPGSFTHVVVTGRKQQSFDSAMLHFVLTDRHGQHLNTFVIDVD